MWKVSRAAMAPLSSLPGIYRTYILLGELKRWEGKDETYASDTGVEVGVDDLAHAECG